jgi:hypothetical protein
MNANSGRRRAGLTLIATCAALFLTATACATGTATGAGKPTAGSQDAGQTCSSADALVHQAMAIHTDRMTAAQYGQAVSIATQLRTLANSAEDDVLQEKLTYTADAVETLAAAVQASDSSAVVGALQVLGGFRKACPIANPLLLSGSSGWAPGSSTTLLQVGGAGPVGGESLVVSDQTPGACAFHDSPLVVPSTLPGSYRLRLWVRAVSGHQKLTVQVRELVGATQVNQAATTVNAGTNWQRVELTLRPKAPKRSALALDVSASTPKAGACFLAASISMTWG